MAESTQPSTSAGLSGERVAYIGKHSHPCGCRRSNHCYCIYPDRPRCEDCTPREAQFPWSARPQCKATNRDEQRCELKEGHGDDHTYFAWIEWKSCAECGDEPQWDQATKTEFIEHEEDCSRHAASVEAEA